jgi:bacillaene synthase trans-acting acyltransferase
MKRRIVFLFSGQGSQYYQMGRDLYEKVPLFRAAMDSMDTLAQEMLGTSIVRVLYGAHGKADPFDDIRLTHPAIFMVEVALAKTVIGLGIKPDFTLGASLGTLAALAVAGCLALEEALALVVEQALAIERHCPKGGMIAVLSGPELYRDSPFLQARSVIAGQSFAGHFVLSAPEDNLIAIESYLIRAGVTHQPLPVHYPFHGPWIEPLRAMLVDPRGAGRIRLSTMPVICCAQGGVLEEIPADYFWQVARKEISFMDTIGRLEQSGPFDYLDLGPSGTLATFLKYLLPKHGASRSFAVLTAFGRDLAGLASVTEQLLAPELAMARM